MMNRTLAVVGLAGALTLAILGSQTASQHLDSRQTVALFTNQLEPSKPSFARRLDATSIPHITTIVAARVAEDVAQTLTVQGSNFAPGTPVTLSATSVTFNWSAGTWASRYGLYVRDVDISPYTLNLNLSTLTGGTSYHWRLNVVNPQGHAGLDYQSAHLHFEVRARGVIADLDDKRLSAMYRLLEPLAAQTGVVSSSFDHVPGTTYRAVLDDAEVRTSVPREMKVGEGGTVVVRIDKRRLPRFGLSPPADTERRVRVGDTASARLVADRRDFDVSEPPRKPQFVWLDDATEFFFSVTPLRAGNRNLKVLLGVEVVLGNSDMAREKLVADRYVSVSHNLPYEAKELASVWIPIGAVLIPAVIFLVAAGRRRFEQVCGKHGKAGF